MNLSALAVRRPIGTAMVFFAVVVLGFVAIGRLPVDLMPSADFPRISVTTRYEGVAPEEIETLITRPIEQAVSTISGVDKIEASSSEGLSRVALRFAWGTDLSEAVNDVRSQLDRLRSRLPEEADAPVIYKFDLSAFPIAMLSVSGNADPRRLRYLADEMLSRRLERVPGVAAVAAWGGREREIQVRLAAERLAAMGISTAEVIAAVGRENRNVAGGDLLDAGREVVIRTVGEYANTDEIARTVVVQRGERPVYVGDLGEVVDTFREVRSELWIDGTPGIRLRVSKQDGSNTVTVVDALLEEVDRINDEYRGTARIDVLRDSSVFIRHSINNVSSSALAGAGLAVIVLLLFLRNVRATTVIALAIPISVLATFALMDVWGISLNVISFGGLALGIGMLVDNSIVLLENIYRKREEGVEAERAAVEGSGEVATAITASTLTTIAVFAPVLFLGGFAGIFFREMAVVVSFALACSLLVALTLVPTLAAHLLGGELLPTGTGLWARIAGRSERAFLALERLYRRSVAAALRRPWWTVVLALAFFLGSLGLFQLVGFELMPETDEGEIDISVELPVGTPIETTMVTMRQVEDRSRNVLDVDELAHAMTFAGPQNWWRPGGSNQGSVELDLQPLSSGRRGVDELIEVVQGALADLPGADIQVRRGSSNFLLRMMRGGGTDRLSVIVRGHDRSTSERLAGEVEALARRVDGVTFAKIDLEPPQLERVVRVDRDRVAELGLRGTDVAEAVETCVLGTVASRFRDEGGEYDIRVRLREADRRHLQQLAHLPLLTAVGRTVSLGQVARITETTGWTTISRENQERILRVNAGVGDRALGDVVGDLQQQLGQIAVPDDFQVEVSGEYLEQQETFRGLFLGLGLAVFLVFAVMAVQFESLRNPLVVMGAVPFAFIGVVLALVLTGTTFNMNSFLGTIVLVGIVVNNAIVLVEMTNLRLREVSAPLVQVVEDAAVRRLRPILMTTLTTSLAMLPLALGMGEGSEIQAPLARVVIGGLLVSTAVTLILVPALYLLTWRRRLAAPAPGGTHAPAG